MASFTQGSPLPNTTSTTGTAMPDWYNSYMQNLSSWGQGMAQQPYQSYTGPRIADVSPQQTEAYNQVEQQTTNPGYQPMLDQAQQTMTNSLQPYSETEMNKYLSPYISGVTDRIATLGNRNLNENILPGINSTFTGAGQFGSTRQGDFTNRAIRDTTTGIADAQATALQNAYDAANKNYAGWNTAGQQNATAAGNLAGQEQSVGLKGAGALEAVGQTLQGQDQQNLNLAYQDFQNQRDYPWQQLSKMQGVMSGAQLPTTQTQTASGGYSASPLSTLLGGLTATAAINKLGGGA